MQGRQEYGFLVGRSYAFHLSCPEQAVRSNEQHKNHNQVGSNLVNFRAQEACHVAFVTGSQVLHQSNNDPADDCPGDRINAAQDDGRECQQRRTPQRRVHGIGTYSEKDPPMVATSAAIPQASAYPVRMLIPTASAASWSSAVARIASP